MNLISLADARLGKQGEKLALVFEEEAFTNIRLREMSRKLAGGLRSLGLGPRDHVAVSLLNCPEVWACFGAVWRIGAVIVPMMFLLGIEESREALRGGWLDTGDVGYLDEDGYFYITDRIEDMIIKGGYNIYPNEIEGYVEAHRAVREVAVIGVPDEKYGEGIMAFVALHPGRHLTEEELISYAQSRIMKFKCPSRVKFVEALPRTLVGKVQRKKLRSMV